MLGRVFKGTLGQAQARCCAEGTDCGADTLLTATALANRVAAVCSSLRLESRGADSRFARSRTAQELPPRYEPQLAHPPPAKPWPPLAPRGAGSLRVLPCAPSTHARSPSRQHHCAVPRPRPLVHLHGPPVSRTGTHHSPFRMGPRVHADDWRLLYDQARRWSQVACFWRDAF
jgi:hypothetical protein